MEYLDAEENSFEKAMENLPILISTYKRYKKNNLKRKVIREQLKTKFFDDEQIISELLNMSSPAIQACERVVRVEKLAPLLDGLLWISECKDKFFKYFNKSWDNDVNKLQSSKSTHKRVAGKIAKYSKPYLY